MKQLDVVLADVVDYLAQRCVRYQIVGGKRMATFIAQTGHESDQLIYVKEISGQRLLKPNTKVAKT